MPDTTNEVGYTPVEVAMLDLLSDGRAHTKAELKACLYDPDGDEHNIFKHICNIRAKMNPSGMDVACEKRKQVTYYRLVRLLSSPYTGYK